MSLWILDLRDRRIKANFFDVKIKTESRIVGTILQHQRETIGKSLFKFYAKKSHTSCCQQYFLKPEYPPFEVANLKKLLKRDKHKSIDDLRFKLLEWIIDDDLPFIDSDVRAIPKEYFRAVLTLYQLVKGDIIDVFEADLILFSLKCVNKGLIPEDSFVPEIVNARAYEVALLFLYFYDVMGDTINCCGLKHLSVS